MNKLIIPILFLALAVSASAQTKLTENTLKLDEGMSGGSATIADFDWLIGTWSGTGLGGTVEEIWSKPQNGVMMGMFRMFSGGKVNFYEFITLEPKGGSYVMRIKHFTPELVGWEEKDKTVDFPFIKKDGGRYYFGGATFVPNGAKLAIYLAMRGRDGAYREAKFEYKRVKPGK